MKTSLSAPSIYHLTLSSLGLVAFQYHLFILLPCMTYFINPCLFEFLQLSFRFRGFLPKSNPRRLDAQSLLVVQLSLSGATHLQMKSIHV